MIDLISLTSEQMSMTESFIGFDFVNVWNKQTIVQSGYPYLNAFPEDIIYDPFIIQGTIISSSGVSLQGIEVIFDDQSIPSITDIDGMYYSTAITQSYTGKAIPTHSNYTFTPVSISFSNVTSDLQNQNFTASYFYTASSFDISGQIFVSGTANAISNVTLSLTEQDRDPVIIYSDVNGQYSYTVNRGFTGAITASHAYYDITPQYQSFSTVSVDYTNTILSGSLVTYYITGWTISSSGYAVTNITMSNNVNSEVVYSDEFGQYTQYFTRSLSYTITPISDIYTFSPGYKVYSNLNSNKKAQNYIANMIIPPSEGLSTYYDSRLAYNDSTKVWTDLSEKGQSILTNNTIYTVNKDLAFGLESMGPSSASFIGTRVSSSFAIEMWIAPNTSSNQKTLLSTDYDAYPYLVAYITSSKLMVDYKSDLYQSNIVKISSNPINELKYNHVVIFVSASNLAIWTNGTCYESSSITASAWNGAIIGINTYNTSSQYKGFVNVFKIWNVSNININDINNYYSSRNYWNDLPDITMPLGEPITDFYQLFHSESMIFTLGEVFSNIEYNMTSSIQYTIGEIYDNITGSLHTCSLDTTNGPEIPDNIISEIKNSVYLSTGESIPSNIMYINEYVQLIVS